MRHIRDHGDDIDEQRSHISQLRLGNDTSDAESESRNNLPAGDTKGRFNKLMYEALQRVPTENNQRYHALLFFVECSD